MAKETCWVGKVAKPEKKASNLLIIYFIGLSSRKGLGVRGGLLSPCPSLAWLGRLLPEVRAESPFPPPPSFGRRCALCVCFGPRGLIHMMVALVGRLVV